MKHSFYVTRIILIPKSNKYRNEKITLDGETFDSKKECRRYYELIILQKAKKISDLTRQVKYVLIPAQRDGEGKLLERECAYIADFVYHDNDNNEVVVEDTKGVRTPEYIIKRKLMLYNHGIKIKEI